MSTCAWKDCDKPQSGKSKYCADCKKVAREKRKEMFAAKAGEKAAREKKWADLHAAAHKAGEAKVAQTNPVPMVVSGYENQPVMGGVCGFAWVKIRPANCSFALWLKKKGIGSTDSYSGGLMIWVSNYGQSMAYKEAYAEGYAQVVRDAGIKAFAMSRMD